MTDDQKQSLATGIQNKEEKLKKDLEEANKKIEELTEMAKRALADLVNYKKRVEAEKAEFVKFANIELILDILGVMDNFDRAFSSIPEELKENSWVKGVMQIEKQLTDIFQKQGIVKLPSSAGQKFDPHKHEIVGQAQGETDTVIEEVAPCYMLHDKIIRPAKVKVGIGSAPPETTNLPNSPAYVSS